jgi:membrane protease YdiL (CAAX protease family)
MGSIGRSPLDNCGVLVAGVTWIERRNIDSIGIRRRNTRDLGLSVVEFILGVIGFGLTQPVVQALGLTSAQTGIGAVATPPSWGAVVIALTAGVTEEVLYRGYPIDRIGGLTGKLWIGGAVTYAVFTSAHIPF